LNFIYDTTIKAFWNYATLAGLVQANQCLRDKGGSMSTKECIYMDKDQFACIHLLREPPNTGATKNFVPPQLSTAMNRETTDKAIHTIPFGKQHWLAEWSWKKPEIGTTANAPTIIHLVKPLIMSFNARICFLVSNGPHHLKLF
jgi:hypothetical protein